MDFNSRVETISPSQLDALFGNTEVTPTPGADNLVVGSQDHNPFINTNANNLVPNIDLDHLENVKAEPTAKEETKDEGKEKQVNELEKQPNAKVEEVKTGDEPTEGAKKEENKEDDLPEQNTEQVNLVLKNTVNYLIDKGLWKDFNGREDLEIDPDTYAELAAKQEESKIDEMFSELVDSTGTYGKAIISHIKNGGDPDEIIDIFKEQKQVQNIDVSDENGAIALIQKYYPEEVGWSKTKIDKYINGLKSEDDGVTDEAKELQSKYDKIYADQVSNIEKAEQDRKKELKKQQQEYINTLSTTIDTFEGFTDKDKKLVKDSVLKFNKKLEDGTPVNDFYLKFYDIQKNPKDYVELIHFIMDKKGYQEKFKQNAETKATDKTWNFVKNNGSITKKNTQITPKENSKTSKIDFSGLFNK